MTRTAKDVPESLIIEAWERNKEKRNSELIVLMGLSGVAGIDMKFSRVLSARRKEAVAPVVEANPEPVTVEAVNPAPVTVEVTPPVTVTVEPVITVTEPVTPDPVVIPDVKPRKRVSFVTATLLAVGAVVALITVYHFSVFTAFGMPLLMAGALSLVMEAGFWASLVALEKHPTGNNYYTFQLLSWVLILFRLFSNASGIYAFAATRLIGVVWFGAATTDTRIIVYSFAISLLLTICDVALARITTEHISNS